MKFKPLHNNVLIELLSDEENGSKTKSGIIIPDTVDKEKSDQGKVLEVGPGKRDDGGKIIPMSVKKGDTVVFSKYSTEEIKVEGKKCLIVSEENILAIIS